VFKTRKFVENSRELARAIVPFLKIGAGYEKVSEAVANGVEEETVTPGRE
jgi:hypothetical protein